jgi:hypothetical protein
VIYFHVDVGRRIRSNHLSLLADEALKRSCGSFFDERRQHDSLKPKIWRCIGGQHTLSLRYDSCGNTLMSLALANLNPEQLRAVEYGGPNYADCGPLLIIAGWAPARRTRWRIAWRISSSMAPIRGEFCC